MPPSSMQNAALGGKSAKFVQANPLDPLLRPFGDDDVVSEPSCIPLYESMSIEY